MKIAKGNRRCPVYRADMPLDGDLERDPKSFNGWSKEIATKGWCGSELWDLDRCIAGFVLPRLKAFKKRSIGRPNRVSDKRWNMMLDEMIWAFDEIVNEKSTPMYDGKLKEKVGKDECYRLQGEYDAAMERK